jgi:hypothetical protein
VAFSLIRKAHAGSEITNLPTAPILPNAPLPGSLPRRRVCPADPLQAGTAAIGLRQVCRNVKRWRDARMALRWTATAMLEAEKGFRHLKAYRQLPVLRSALLRHQQALLERRAHCRKKSNSIGFNQWRLLHQFQQAPGLSDRSYSGRLAC